MACLGAAVALALLVTIDSCGITICRRLILSSMWTSRAREPTTTNPGQIKIHQDRLSALILFIVLVVRGESSLLLVC